MQGEKTTITSQAPTSYAQEHGGRLAEARRLFPDAPEPFLDLSTGINPAAYPIGALPPELWTRLPEPDADDALRRAAALAYGAADPAMVVPAPGTQLLISLLPHLLPYREVAILGPTYGEHLASWQAAGATAREVPDLGAASPSPCVVLCNPNNPDGRRLDPAHLLALADDLALRDGLLIIDEAFADFEPPLSLVPALPHPAILILRSFGKAYGLAGLRLGFALTTPARAAHLRAALGPWSISGPAAAIGRQALADRAWRSEQSALLTRSAQRLDALLSEARLSLVGGTNLFRLFEASQAKAVFSRLGEAGLLVRRFTAHPTWLRFGIPGPAVTWSRLEAALLQPSIADRDDLPPPNALRTQSQPM